MRPFVPCTQILDGPRGLGMCDRPGQLRRERHQNRLLVLVESPPRLLLNYQHAKHSPVMDDRYPQKRVIALLTDFGEQMEARMAHRVFQIEGLGTLPHLSNQTFVRRERNLAHRRTIETLRGHEHVTATYPVHQKDGRHLGAHDFTNTAHGDRQRRLQIRRRVHLLNYASQAL